MTEVLPNAEVRERKQALLVHLVSEIAYQVGPHAYFFVNFVEKFLISSIDRPLCDFLSLNLQSVNFDLFRVEFILKPFEFAFQLLVQNLNFAKAVEDDVEVVTEVANPDDFFLF